MQLKSILAIRWQTPPSADKQGPTLPARMWKHKGCEEMRAANPDQKKVEDCGCGSAVACLPNKKRGARLHLWLWQIKVALMPDQWASERSAKKVHFVMITGSLIHWAQWPRTASRYTKNHTEKERTLPRRVGIYFYIFFPNTWWSS